jgi:hypothetical protein
MRLDSTVARFPDDACPLDFPRMTFLTEILKCLWNRIVGVNPLPRGANVGEFRKTCHPQNVEVHEIREDLEYGTHEVSESRMHGGLESRTLEASESRTRYGSES